MSTTSGASNPETQALLTKDAREKSRGCLCGESFCCWNEACCFEEASSKPREAFWDNFRGLAQLCVLFLHLGHWMYLTPSKVFVDSIPGRLYFGLGSVVFLIAMPSFCFISGYFSEPQPQKRQFVNQLRYSVTWFIQHSLQFLLMWQSLQQSSQSTWEAQHPLLNETNAHLESEGKAPLQPPSNVPFPFWKALGLDWYLWCVVIWRFVLPELSMLERPLLASFCISFLMMWTDAHDNVYSFSPFGFLPFFVAGFQFRGLSQTWKDDLESYHGRLSVKCSFGIALVVIASLCAYSLRLRDYVLSGIFCCYGGSPIDAHKFQGLSHHLREFDMDAMMEAMEGKPTPVIPRSTFCQSPKGLVTVVFTYVASLTLLGLLMFSITSRKIPILTKMGVNSLYIYFGHQWFAMMPTIAVCFALHYNKIAFNPWFTIVFLLALIVGFGACLSQQWLRCFCKPFVEPDVESCCLRKAKEEQ